MKKIATKVALGLLAACSVGVIAAPTAHAEYVLTKVPTEFWVVRLDSASTSALANQVVRDSAVSVAVWSSMLDLPDELGEATFELWAHSVTAQSTKKTYGPQSCLELRIPMTRERHYNYSSAGKFMTCPWAVPSVHTERGHVYTVVQR